MTKRKLYFFRKIVTMQQSEAVLSYVSCRIPVLHKAYKAHLAFILSPKKHITRKLSEGIYFSLVHVVEYSLDCV